MLQAHLEPWLAALVADEPPVPLDGTFVEEDLRGSQSDKLFQVPLKGGEPGFVHLLLEHKSSPDPGTALQVLKYEGAHLGDLHPRQLGQAAVTAEDRSARLLSRQQALDGDGFDR